MNALSLITRGFISETPQDFVEVPIPVETINVDLDVEEININVKIDCEN